MTIGQAFTIRFKELLNEHNISLYKFAKNNCIPRSTLVNVMIGRSKSPTLTLIYQVAHGFGMTHLEFLNHPVFFRDEIEYL